MSNTLRTASFPLRFPEPVPPAPKLLLHRDLMSQVVSKFEIHLNQVEGFEFRADFDNAKFETLLLDEPPPLGKDAAPNAARILAAAIGDCLSASLVFCLKRAGVELSGFHSDVGVEIVRNEDRRLRIGAVDVTLRPRLPGGAASLGTCLTTFEDFCIVTQSVRSGIDVRVKVEPDLAPLP